MFEFQLQTKRSEEEEEETGGRSYTWMLTWQKCLQMQEAEEAEFMILLNI